MRAIVLVSTVQNPEEPLNCSENDLLRVPENEIVNDFDLIALEAAVQLKEAGHIDEVIVFSMSAERKHLQKLLAAGADSAVWACAENKNLSPEIVARTALNAFAPTPDTIWMTGKLGVNFESHLTAQMLAVQLGCPCLEAAYQIEKTGDCFAIRCEDETGMPTYSVQPPFVVTADLRLATPRFPSLPAIIKAKKKPIAEISMEPEIMPRRAIQSVGDRRRQCIFVNEDSLMELIKGCK